MNSDVIQILLVVLVVLVAANLLGLVLLWVHIDRGANNISALNGRVARLEERQASSISPGDVRALYADLAEIKGRVAASVDLMKTIQEHLLERDQ